ncbi:translation initiation factor IF-6 [Candidatus Micrarchaeota archaeon]|nr:translation initiation factor IF-6 [Candidatus Micrarchaeota archaeon]
MDKITYFGNPWVGMFARSNDQVTLVPVDSNPKFSDPIAANLKTKLIPTFIGDSNLIGLYCVMNSNGIVLPNIIKESELAKIKSETGLNVHVSSEKYNALGNNLAVNDKGGIANPYMERSEISKISDVLGIEIVPMSIGTYSTVGSCCLVTNTGFLSHFRTSPVELEQLKSIFKVFGNKGTVNMGVGFIPYGIIINANGYVAGENTSAFELGRVEEALDLIK